MTDSDVPGVQIDKRKACDGQSCQPDGLGSTQDLNKVYLWVCLGGCFRVD